jgi:hypothetical protein
MIDLLAFALVILALIACWSISAAIAFLLLNFVLPDLIAAHFSGSVGLTCGSIGLLWTIGKLY